MGRRKNSAFDDLIAGGSKLPWKIGVASALIIFMVLHIVAQQSSPTSAPPNPPAMGAFVMRQYIHVFATFLQFLIPAGLLIGACVSFIKGKRSGELVDSVLSSSGLEISSLSWREFEALVAEGFRQRRFKVVERGGAGPDGGVDLALARAHERFLLQCKQWRSSGWRHRGP
jgi:restriction system protein